jgi:hypothetical protein
MPLFTIKFDFRKISMAMRRPHVSVRFVTKESSMSLVYKITAGVPVDADVVARELSITQNGETIVSTAFPGDAIDLGEVRAEQGTTIIGSLVDVDDAGNRSQPATFEFVATDTIPPAQPGAFGATLVREEG